MAEELEDLSLYVRGKNTAEEIEDAWDDTAIRNAYDKALEMANAEVAKRIAMETNSSHNKNSNVKPVKDKPKPKKQTTKPALKTEWKGGMPCRAIYEDDGFEYEAFLVRIIDEEDCIVKFLGYDNSEKVKISTLKPTHGDEERMRQLEAALGERADDGFESQTASESVELYSDAASSPRPAEKFNNKKNKSKQKKKKQDYGPDFGELPNLPMPSMNMFRNMGGADMPLPPPPPLGSLSERSDAEEQAISDMLLSWYMTGYYTGLYQGMKRQRQSRRYN